MITSDECGPIMGKEGVVDRPLDPQAGRLIRVQGQIWSALSEQERVIPEETAVRVSASVASRPCASVEEGHGRRRSAFPYKKGKDHEIVDCNRRHRGT